MKSSLHLVLLVLLLSPGIAICQSADEIVVNHFNNTGGIDNWRALTGIKSEALVDDEAMDIPSTKIQMKDGRIIVKFTLNNQEMVQVAYDGEVVWGDDFINSKPVISSDDITRNVKLAAVDFPSPLLNYKANGYTLTLEGKEMLDEQECYKLKLEKKKQYADGKLVDNITYYYITTSDYMLVAEESVIQVGQLKGNIRRDLYSDFQQVDGLTFPFMINREIEEGGKLHIHITSIELNPQVDDAVFKYQGE